MKYSILEVFINNYINKNMYLNILKEYILQRCVQKNQFFNTDLNFLTQ